jgi:hypothetical protein
MLETSLHENNGYTYHHAQLLSIYFKAVHIDHYSYPKDDRLGEKAIHIDFFGWLF